MQTAVSNTIMGVSIVFFVLVSLSFLIYLFRFIPMLEEKLTKKKIAEPVKQEVPVEVPVEKDPRQYIVRSIKKVHRNQW